MLCHFGRSTYLIGKAFEAIFLFDTFPVPLGQSDIVASGREELESDVPLIFAFAPGKFAEDGAAPPGGAHFGAQTEVANFCGAESHTA